MRILDQAIQEQLHESDEEFLKGQVWENFERAVQSGTLWIFGVGEGAEFYLRRYGERFPIKGFLDNDPRKQGSTFGDLTNRKCGMELSGTGIYAPAVLERMQNMQPPVVLVTSIRYCEEIIAQLKSAGIVQIFSLLHMEANRRQSLPENMNSHEEQKEDERVLYAEECLRYPVQRNKILFARDEAGGHGKRILSVLVQLQTDLELVWVTERNGTDLPQGIRLISPTDTQHYIYELETAYIWVFGDMIPEFAIKRDEQIYIQVKHWAGLTLKSFYMHLDRHLKIPAIYNYYKHNSEALDYIFVGSRFDEETCRSGFCFDGECIYVGSPRTDILFLQGVRNKVLKSLQMDADVHILLYAPTFRAQNQNTIIGKMGNIDLDFYMLRNALERRFGGTWVILLRIHPDVAIESYKVKHPDFVIDVTAYPDSEELVAVADVLISDYSSIIFEPAFVGKKVFRYAPDKEEYISQDRNLLMDYNRIPFPLAESNGELEQCILNFNEQKYQRDVKTFLDVYGVHEDGHAAERAAAYIIKLMQM